jgi:D-alanyl-D-alanine carboxypeptidase (penicillin-binding protein 5/6)
MRYNSPRPRHKRHIFRNFLIILILAAGLYVAYKLVISPSQSKKPVSSSLTLPVLKPVWPAYGSGAVGAVGFNGVVASYGTQSARPIASLTKIITALVVLQAKPLKAGEEGPDIQFTQSDVDIYNQEIANDAAVKPVYAGTSMTERKALETMILPSAANYAIMLANWAYGSVDAYLVVANSWLKSHNLTKTTVVDTSGLMPGSVSSPGDLITIGKLALANPALASIVATKQANIPNVGIINNGNGLLGQVGINGIKTGVTSEAGVCMLFSSVVAVGKKKITIVGDLLGANERGQQNSDVIKLLNSIQPAFRSFLSKK